MMRLTSSQFFSFAPDGLIFQKTNLQHQRRSAEAAE